MAKLIVHRPYDGDHITDSPDCWCSPVVAEVADDTDEIVKTLDQLLKEAEPRPN